MNGRGVIAPSMMAATGAVVFLSLPLLVGLIIDTLSLTESQAGIVASTYFVAYLVASTSSIYWLHHFSLRSCATCAYLLMGCGLVLAGFSSGLFSIASTLAIAGAGGGMLFSLGVAIVAAGNDADRNYGWLLVAQQTLAAGCLFVIPSWVVPQWGMPGALVTLGILSLIMMPTMYLGPNTVTFRKELNSAPSEARNVSDANGALVLLAVHFAGLSALWAFVERIGVNNNISSTEIGSALSLSMFGGLAGALWVTQLGDRWGRKLPLWFATTLFVVACLGYTTSLTWLPYLLLTGLLSFAWNFVLAFQMGIISDLDQAGTRASLIPAAQGLGAVIGPAIGGTVLGFGGQTSLLLTVILICIFTAILFSIFATRTQG